MKKYLLVLVMGILYLSNAHAQIMCIQCYPQNARLNPAANNLLLNGDFENFTNLGGPFDYICPKSSGYNCNIANWTCKDGGSGTYALLFTDTSSYQAGNVAHGHSAVYMGNKFCVACDTLSPYVPACLQFDSCTVAGVPNNGYPVNDTAFGGRKGVSLSQTVSGLTAGHIYVLEFWAGGEKNGTSNFTDDGLFALDLGFGKTYFACPPTEPGTGIGKRYMVVFKATATNHTVTFTNWGHISPTATELILDDVHLYTLAQAQYTPVTCINGEGGQGINNVDAANIGFTAYPNPFTEQLSINIAGGKGKVILSLYNLLGQKIYTTGKAAKDKITLFNVNTTALVKGMYYVAIDINNVRRVQKVIKE